MAATKTRSLSLSCPCCGADAEGADLILSLTELPKLTCQSCDESFTPAEAVERLRAQLDRWVALAAWIEKAPRI